VRTRTLNKPLIKILGVIRRLKAEYISRDFKFFKYILVATAQYPKLASTFVYPGEKFNKLFNIIYNHKTSKIICDNCNRYKLVLRRTRYNTIPQIYYRNIASGNKVIRYRRIRD